MDNHHLTFWKANYEMDENPFASMCQFSSYDYGRSNANDGYLWPYDFALQDYPFMDCYYSNDILYETLPIAPTPLSMQGYDFCDVKNVLSAWNEIDGSHQNKPVFSSSNGGDSLNEMKEGDLKSKQCREERSGSAKTLTRKTVSQYFYMPISQAAKELNVGLTHLKKRCRELGIQRWPHRKLMSLQTLIKNIQINVVDEATIGEQGDEGHENDEKIRAAIEMLEKEKRMVEEMPDLELEDKTRRLRQACFKANYKKRKFMGLKFMEPQSSLSGLS